MKRLMLVLFVAAIAVGCGQNNGNNVAPTKDAGNNGGSDATANNVDPGDGGTSDDDGGETSSDAGNNQQSGDQGDNPNFCDTVDCAGETPFCSELIDACVECLSDNDCTTAPEQTCETFGDGEGGAPLFECVECVRDDQCGNATCNLETNTCEL